MIVDESRTAYDAFSAILMEWNRTMSNSASLKGKRQAIALFKAVLPLSVRARINRQNGLQAVSASVWNQEFGAGKWDFLGSAREMPRYAVIAGYFGAGDGPRSVLDVGCGAGLLQPWLKRVGYAQYFGVDLSDTAIEAAQAFADPQTRFEAANAESFAPPGQFDVIIFNEMLYYMHDPVAMLRRYAGHLASGGVFIVSLWESRESGRAWSKVRGTLEVLDETSVVRTGVSWRIRVCRPA